MSYELILSIAQKSIVVILIVSGPLLAIALIVGLLISILQATTQIQEQTLSFVPKIVAMLIGIIFFGPWMLTHILTYANYIFSNLSKFIG